MTPKYITDQDQAVYRDFFKHHIEQVARSRGKCPLYHYTSGSTLIKILSTNSLWMTQVSCLNDAKEWVFAIEAFREVLLEFRKAGKNPRAQPCLDLMEEVTREVSQTTVSAFVTCFSSEWDDLSQWRAYGGEAGYSLGFDFDDLSVAVLKKSMLLVPVLYGDDSRILLEDAVRWAADYYVKGIDAARAPTASEWTEDFARFWLWNLSFFAPMIKHAAFKAEKEWRIIHHLKDDDFSKMEFLQRRGMMTRHLPIQLGAGGGGRTGALLPLTRVTIGPTNHAEISMIGVGDLLRSCGYPEDVKPERSDLPYRPYL